MTLVITTKKLHNTVKEERRKEVGGDRRHVEWR